MWKTSQSYDESGTFFYVEEFLEKFRNGKLLVLGESKFVDENRMKFVMECSKLSSNWKSS